MTGGIRRRLIVGLASSALGPVLSALQTFLLVPFFVAAWDAETYGHWLVLSAIASHLTLADFGGQNFVANALAMHFGRDEQDDVHRRLSEAMSLFLAVGAGLFAVLAAAVAWAAWWPAGAAGPLLTAEQAAVLLQLGALALLLAMPGGIYTTVYRASGQFARGALIGNGGRVVQIAGCVAILAAGGRPAAVASWLLAVGAATTLMIVGDTRRVIPSCRRVRLSLASARAGASRLVRGSLPFGVIGAATEMTQQGVVLILAAMAGPVAVAVYSTHRALAGLPGSLLTLAHGPMSPELSFLWAQRRYAELIRMSLLTTTTVMALGAVVAAVIWLVAPIAYPRWTAGALEFDPALGAVLICQGLVSAGWFTSAWSLLATNQPQGLARWSVARAAVTVVLAAALARSLGPLGVALAVLTADVVCGALIVPVLSGARLGAPSGRFYARMGLGLLPLAPLVASAVASFPQAGDQDHTREAAAALTAVLAIGIAWPHLMPMARTLQVRWRT